MNTQTHSFIPLSANLKRNSFSYTILRRGSNAMIYEQRAGKKTIAFEVFKILIDKPKDILGKQIPARERFPKSEDFGFTAWTYKTIEKALSKYFEIENPAI